MSHETHCDQGEYIGACKYGGDDSCPVLLKNASPAVMLARMIAIAAERHVDQFDSAGVPYIMHPIKVMHYLKTSDYELMCIAVGHDLIEDTKSTFDELRELGASGRVIQGLHCLTKMPGETHEQMMSRLLSNTDACLVKLADMRHNSDIRRGKGLREKDFDRLEKYHRMYKRIVEHLKGLGLYL